MRTPPMRAPMPTLERRISLRGPRFWRDGEVLMFAYQLDASTRHGPRPATDADKDGFPEALAQAEVPSADPPGGPVLLASDPETGRPPARGRGH
jgi:hypothetical protein